MQQKQPLCDLFAPRRKRRRGMKRFLTHIALFAALGALLLAGGIFGRARLMNLSDEYRLTLRAETLHAQVLSETQAVMNAAASDSAAVKKISTGFSSKKSNLKKTIAAQAAEGMTNEEILSLAIDTLMEGVSNKFDAGDAALAAVLAAAEDARESIIASVGASVLSALDHLTPGDVRRSLSKDTEVYGLVYYATALILCGAVFLALSLTLTVLWRCLNMDGRSKAADIMESMDYLLPFFLGVAIFTLYPMIRVIIMSFQERYILTGDFNGWGLDNYKYVIMGVPGASNYFIQGLRNTFVYVLLTVPVSAGLSIVLANLLNQKLKFSALFQTAYFMPMVTSVTAVGLVWRWMFNKDFGLINALLGLFGMEKINWLMDASNSMTALTLFGIWSSLPFTIILLLSGLQNIDENLYTVARVDGAKAFRIFRRITVPLLSPTIGLVLIINSISAFKVFTDVKVLFNGNPGPFLNLYTVVYYIYDQMYLNRELGRAAAAAIVLFLFIFAFTMAQRVIQRKWTYQ